MKTVTKIYTCACLFALQIVNSLTRIKILRANENVKVILKLCGSKVWCKPNNNLRSIGAKFTPRLVGLMFTLLTRFKLVVPSCCDSVLTSYMKYNQVSRFQQDKTIMFETYCYE